MQQYTHYWMATATRRNLGYKILEDLFQYPPPQPDMEHGCSRKTP